MSWLRESFLKEKSVISFGSSQWVRIETRNRLNVRASFSSCSFPPSVSGSCSWFLFLVAFQGSCLKFSSEVLIWSSLLKFSIEDSPGLQDSSQNKTRSFSASAMFDMNGFFAHESLPGLWSKNFYAPLFIGISFLAMGKRRSLSHFCVNPFIFSNSPLSWFEWISFL